MQRQFYTLSKYKIQSLEVGPGTVVVDDLIDIFKDSETKIVDNSEIAKDVCRTLKARHKYLVTIKEVG